MGQVFAKIRQLITKIVSRYSSSRTSDQNIQSSNATAHGVEKLRERQTTVKDDAHVIAFESDDLEDKTSTNKNVQENDQIFGTPDVHIVTILEDKEEGSKKSDQSAHRSSPDLLGKTVGLSKPHASFSDLSTSDVPEKNDVITHIASEVQQENGSNKCVASSLTWIDIAVQNDASKNQHKWIKHYCSSHKILLVGEGDFSFSRCLAKAFGSATNMVATSLDSNAFLQKNYAMAMSNINYLKSKGCTVRHNFDATAMWNNRHLLDYSSKFDRIVYNFPLAGFFPDLSQERTLKRNKHFVRMFMGNAKKMIHDNGEIHITHKANGFFLKWDLDNLGKENGLQLIRDVKFTLSDYPGYKTKYGFGGDNNFNCNPSRTYVFSLMLSRTP